MSSPTVFSGVHVALSLVFCVLFCILLFVFFSFFFLTIVLSVHLRLTGSDYPFGIFNKFFKNWLFQRISIFNVQRKRNKIRFNGCIWMFSTKTVCRSHKYCLFSFLHFAMGCVLSTFSDVLNILLVLLIVLTVQGNVLLHPDPRLEAVSKFVVSSNACKIRSQWALLLTIWCSDYVYRTGCDWIMIHYCIRWVEQHSWSHLEGVAVCSTFWNKIYPNKHKINPFFILSGISSVKNE
jgi:hypothetical protein